MPEDLAMAFALMGTLMWACVPVMAMTAGPCAALPLGLVGLIFIVLALTVLSVS